MRVRNWSSDVHAVGYRTITPDFDPAFEAYNPRFSIVLLLNPPIVCRLFDDGDHHKTVRLSKSGFMSEYQSSHDMSNLQFDKRMTEKDNEYKELIVS